MALGAFLNIYFLRQIGDEMVSSLSTKEIENKLQTMSERVSKLNLNLDSLSSFEVRQDLSKIITDFQGIITSLNSVSAAVSSSSVVDSLTNLSNDMQNIRNQLASLDRRETVDYSTQIEGIRGKIVSLEWQLEELKSLVESSMVDVKNAVSGTVVSNSPRSVFYEEEVGKGANRNLNLASKEVASSMTAISL